MSDFTVSVDPFKNYRTIIVVSFRNKSVQTDIPLEVYRNLENKVDYFRYIAKDLAIKFFEDEIHKALITEFTRIRIADKRLDYGVNKKPIDRLY